MRSTKPTTRIHRRRGVSLPIVLISISLSLMLTYATLNSQTRNIQIRQNVNRQELAHQAAESGVAVALNQLQSASWAGVSTAITGTLSSDAFGTATYSVQFLTIDGQTSPTAYAAGGGQTSIGSSTTVFDTSANGLSSASAASATAATKNALQLLIRSTGKWQSAAITSEFVTGVIEVGAELQPRVPGRTISHGDTASASDVKPNAASYDTVQSFALFATAGDSTNRSLTLDPGHRVDGPCWLSRGVRIFRGPQWGSTTRNEFFQSTGSLYSTSSNGQMLLPHPHPFGGGITMSAAFTSTESADLTKLNVPRQQAASIPTAPTVSFSNWQRYQLFQGGFTYDAVTLTSGSLDNVVLRPTPRNPLGIFYRSGDLTIDDNVVIQGTLVCTQKVQFTGNNNVIASFNWRDDSGAVLFSEANLYPRVPAIICQNIDFNRDVRVNVDGAVMVTGTVTGGDGSYERVTANDVNVAGAQATTIPMRQPYSQVQLPSNSDLSNVLSNGQHAIWLADGITGNWYAIVNVDTANKRLTVLGEASRTGPVNYRISRQRLRHIDLRGPLMTGRLTLTGASPWVLGSSFWSYRYSIWQFLTDTQRTNNLPVTPFVSWVGAASSYPGWGNPYETEGLPLEPTFHLRPLQGVTYRESLPVFRNYTAPTSTGTSTTSTVDPSGYRWRVLFWRNP